MAKAAKPQGKVKAATSKNIKDLLAGCRAMALPRKLTPMLATLVDAPPAGEGWLFEIKCDGYRAVAFLQ